MRAIELLELYFIPAPLQVEEQTPAAVYGQDPVSCAMRDKDPRRARFPDPGWDESGRKSQDALEEVTVGYAEAQRVGGAIRKAADSHSARVHMTQSEDFAQSLINKSHVWAVAGSDRVPGVLERSWGEENETELVG